jgi:hypothetical protein
MNKTNIELARECQLLDGLAVVPSQVDRYTAIVEARLMAKLLEGAGEPVAYQSRGGSIVEWHNLSKTKERIVDFHNGFVPPEVRALYTADQTSAAVLRADECDELASFLACHGDKAGAGICTSMAESIRNRKTK